MVSSSRPFAGILTYGNVMIALRSVGREIPTRKGQCRRPRPERESRTERAEKEECRPADVYMHGTRSGQKCDCMHMECIPSAAARASHRFTPLDRAALIESIAPFDDT